MIVTKDGQEANGKAAALNDRLLPQHLADLRKSGLSDEQIERCGFHSLQNAVSVQKALRWRHYHGELGDCLAIPFCDADGKGLDYCRLKPDRPRRAKKDGKPIKYESPKGVSNQAYFPPNTLAALQNPSIPLLITEGEKKSAKADQEGFACIGLVGVYGWQKKRSKDKAGKPQGERQLIDALARIPWQGRGVFLTFDSDAAPNPNVPKAEWHLAECLARHGAAVKVLRLPPGDPGPDGAPTKVGLDDYLVVHRPEDFRALMAKAKALRDEKKENQAQVLLRLAAEIALFHDVDRRAYATVPVNDHHETLAIRSGDFKRWLVRVFYCARKKPPSATALNDALGVIEARAIYDSPELPVHIRLAELDGNIYLDLCNSQWEIAKITPDGWSILPSGKVPVKFRRTRGMLSLPRPERGGRLDDLRSILGITDLCQWRLLIGCLVMAFRPRGPYPVLGFHGEQGSGKSTAARFCRSLIDPHSVPVRSEPKEPRDLMISANNVWLIVLDNLSHLSVWLSDALCRLATGGGFGTRELYTNDEEQLFDSMRPVFITGIEAVATRPDLLDRSILLNLPAIPEEKRRTEEELYAELEPSRPGILGALLDVVACALQNFSTTTLPSLPRMADFAKWVTAAEPALGWERGSFLAAYRGSQDEANDVALDAYPIVEPLRQLMATEARWEGKPSELLTKLGELAGEKVAKSDGWPKRANILSGHLKRLAPNLRKVGVHVAFGSAGRGTAKARRIVIQADKPADSPSQSSPSSPTGEKRSYGDDGSPGGDDTLRNGDEPGYEKSRRGDAGDAGNDHSPPVSNEPDEREVFEL
jgi:hypothetical protein